MSGRDNKEEIMKRIKVIFICTIFLLLISYGCNSMVDAAKETPVSTIEHTPATLIPNPAAYYCDDIMGYEYQIVTTEDGSQTGVCIMPDGEVCDQWTFYSGECGASYSYCAQEGLSIETRSDGQDPYAQTYGVCVDSEGQVQYKISDLFNNE
jgi:putative hemolysin